MFRKFHNHQSKVIFFIFWLSFKTSSSLTKAAITSKLPLKKVANYKHFSFFNEFYYYIASIFFKLIYDACECYYLFFHKYPTINRANCMLKYPNALLFSDMMTCDPDGHILNLAAEKLFWLEYFKRELI